MNKGKAYSYLGAILGTGAGFGVGGLSGEVVGYDSDLVWFYFIILFIVSLGLEVMIIQSVVISLIFFFALLPYYGFVTTYWMGGLFLLALPPAALGTIYGCCVGESIGKKADEREQERRLYQQKIREYNAKYEQLKREGYESDEELEELLK